MTTNTNNVPKMKIRDVEITINFNAPISIGASEAAINGNIPKGWGAVETAPSIEDRIRDQIVTQFGARRADLMDVVPFKSCYDQYVIGTTGDVTYVAWVHPDGRLIIKQQCW